MIVKQHNMSLNHTHYISAKSSA